MPCSAKKTRWLICLCLGLVSAASACAKSYSPADFAQEAIRPREFVYLKVPHLRQDPMYCVPASALIVIRYYGADAGQDLLASMASKNSQQQFGTKFSDLKRALERLGYDWQVTSTKAETSTFDADFAQLKLELEAGRPVLIAGVMNGGNHVVVLIGYDERGQTVFLCDPASEITRPYSGAFIMSKVEFKRFWDQKNWRNWMTTAKNTGTPAGPGAAKPAAAALTQEQILTLLDKLAGKLGETDWAAFGVFEEALDQTGQTFEKTELLRPDQQGGRSAARSFSDEGIVQAIGVYERQGLLPVIATDSAVFGFQEAQADGSSVKVFERSRKGAARVSNVRAASLRNRLISRGSDGEYRLTLYGIESPAE